MGSGRYRSAHGQDFGGASKLGKSAYAGQHAEIRRVSAPASDVVVNKPYAKAAGFNVYKEKPGSRRGMRGRIKGRAY